MKNKEICGFFGVFVFTFILISILSYDYFDPSFFNATTISNTPIHNQFGKLGAYFASFVLYFFGFSAYSLPFLFILFVITFLKKEEFYKEDFFSPFLGIFLFLLSFSVLTELFENYFSFWSMQDKLSSGGILGLVIKDLSIKYLNLLGCFILFFTLLTLSLVLITRLSIFQILKVIKRFIFFLILSIKRFFVSLINFVVKKRSCKIVEKQKNIEPAQKNKNLISSIKKDWIKSASKEDENFNLPNCFLLNKIVEKDDFIDEKILSKKAKLLESKLGSFGVVGEVERILPGPVITTFEYKPSDGIKISKIENLSKDLALALSAQSVRILAPIPGRDVVGIEIPNDKRSLVAFSEIVDSDEFKNKKSKLSICLGKDILGDPVVVGINKMPHLLIAGATGTGKSVGLNSMIASLLFKARYDEVKLLMIDPKRIELSVYDGIPHLITPVITDVKKAKNALFWAVKEMERRYLLLSEFKVRNIDQYNLKISNEKEAEHLPFIVIIIDEFADLMMVASRDIEIALARLAQMARAAGIHLILATQRPSVDVITGIIKANFPTRISFQVSSKIDSRTILDSVGAENLLGNGDMLFLPPGTAKLQRVHGSYIADDEIARLIEYLKKEKGAEYDVSVIESIEKEEKEEISQDDYDEKYDEAIAFVLNTRKTSISSIQRQFKIGYNRAARIVETMEKEGVLSPQEGSKAREILINKL